MRFFRWLIFSCLLLPACAGPRGAGLFQTIRELRPDGKVSAPLAEKDLSPFQLLLRQSFPAPAGSGIALFGKSKPAPAAVQAVWALEVDRPGGDDSAGGYMALVREGQSVEVRYYEQSDHRPRVDRYYHRLLSDDELAAWEELQRAHPLAQLRALHPGAAGDHAVAPAGARAADPAAASDGAAGAEGAAADDGLTIRITDARPGAALTASFSAPLDPLTAQLITQLRHMRDAGGFACTYVRSIPLTARSLYADPEHKVLWVWNRGEDLRIAVGADPDGSAVQWLAYQSGHWAPSTEPGDEAAPAAATEPATEPAGESTPAETSVAAAPGAGSEGVPATAPAATAPGAETPLENPGLLPTAEKWWTQPQQDATIVMHYVPQSAMYGVTHGFVVPGFQFDDAHCAVNPERGLLYLIHDGQLFSLEIPAGAR